MNAIDTAMALSVDGDRDWGETLRATLDSDGVSDVERLEAVLRASEVAREILACVSLDADGETTACALDQTFEVATTLATLLCGIAAKQEP